MKRQSISAAIAGVFVLSLSAAAQGENAIKTFQEEVRAYYAQAKSYAAPKAAKLKDLRGQILPLQAQLKNTKDAAARRQLVSQLGSLRTEISALAEEIALHDIEVIRQSLAFDRRRLESAQQRLAKIRAAKTKRE